MKSGKTIADLNHENNLGRERERESAYRRSKVGMVVSEEKRESEKESDRNGHRQSEEIDGEH